MNAAENKKLYTAAAFALIISAVILYFSRIIFSSGCFFIGDIYTQFFPWKTFLKNSLLNGVIPFWNPMVFSGTPFLADIQKAAFYPPGIVFILFEFPLALKIYVITHFLIMGFGIFSLLRDLNFSRISSAAGTIIFLFNSFTVSQINFISALASLSLMPVILLVFYRFLNKGKIINFGLLVLFISLSVLAGHPPVLIYTFFFMLLFYIYHARKASNSRSLLSLIVSPVVFLVLIFILVTAATMPQSGLFIELISNSSRISGFSYASAASTSMDYRGLLGFIMPAGIKGININYLADWLSYSMGRLNFFSVTFMFLLLISFFYPKSRLYKFSLITALLSVILALGKNTPVHSWFFSFIPYFSSLRHPGFAIVLLLVPVSVITASTIEHIKKRTPIQLSLFERVSPLARVNTYLSYRFSNRLFGFFIILCLVFILLAFNSASVSKVYGLDPPGFVKLIFGYLAFLFIFGLNILFYSLKEKRNISVNFYLFLLIFMVLFELVYFISPINPVASPGIYDLKKPPPEIMRIIKTSNYKFIHTPPSSRVRSVPGINIRDAQKNFIGRVPSNTGMLYGLYDAAGYDTIHLKSYRDFIRPVFTGNTVTDRARLNMMNVKYILSAGPLSGGDFDKIYDSEFLKVYKNQKALPVFFVSGAPDSLNLIMSQSSWTRKHEYDFSLYKAHVNVRRSGFLVFSNNYYPGWKCYVDNKKAEMCRCFGSYMGVEIKKGVHDITFKYSPENFRLFISFFIAGFLAFFIAGILLALVVFWRK